MTELAVVLAVIAALIAVVAVLIAVRLVGSPLRRSGAAVTAEHQVPPATKGALVPISSPRQLPDLAKISLERLPERVNAQAALVIDYRDHLSSELQLARTNGTLDTIKGPVASALASLLGNPQFMNTVLGKAGYYIVKASPGAKFLTAHGNKVAQEASKAGQAGARAVVVGGAAFAMTPVLASVALSAVAEYILITKIERVGKVADLVHHRQLAEALSTADQVLELIGRLRAYDDPRDWPEVLISPLVTAHHELTRQAFAAERLRVLILGNDPDETKRPSDPGAGDKSSAFHELAAGYEIYAVAAQAAAARLVHAQAHDDDVTTAEMEWQLHRHIGQLREHHKAIDAVTNRKSRLFKQGWGNSLKGLRGTHSAVIALIEAQEYQFLLALDGPKPELLALPAASIEIPVADHQAIETAAVME